MSWLQWLVALTCGFTMFVDGYDMQVMALAVPTLAREWAVDPARFSWALSAVSIGLGVGAAFLAPLGDRLGRRTLVIIALSLVGLATLATAMASSPLELVAWRALTGVGLGMGIPNCNAWTSEYTPRASRATWLVLMNACIAIGAFCAGSIAPNILDAWGWRGAFVLGGCVPLAIALLALTSTPESLKFLITRRPGDVRIPQTLRRIAPDLGEVTPVVLQGEAPPQPSLIELLRPAFRGRTLMLWGVVLANLFTLWMLISWLPTLLERAEWSKDAAVRGVLPIQAGGVLGGLVLSYFVDRGKTLPALRVAFAMAGLSLALFTVAPSGAAWMLLLALVGCGVNGAQLALNALSTAYYPPAIKATGMSWVGVAGQVGSSVAPLVGGWVISTDLTAVHILALLGLVPILCALSTRFMRREWQGD